MLTRQQFTSQLFDLREKYRQDNRWVAQRIGDWTDEAIMASFITCAYNLYAATARNALRLTVLGGTEIRKTDYYVRNFGVTAANGIQEEETKIYVIQEQLRRGLRAKFTNPEARQPDRSSAPVTGSGSILSEKGWTPILNDSLILGAITAGQDFVLALTPEEQADWNVMNAGKINRTAVLAAKFGDTPTLISAWKSFFNSQKRIFFLSPSGAPRVFARELLGLHFFGYKPEFSWYQLGFRAGAGRRDQPDFATYVRKLHEVGFHVPDQAEIMKAISVFLFNDRGAIGSPWLQTTKIA